MSQVDSNIKKYKEAIEHFGEFVKLIKPMTDQFRLFIAEYRELYSTIDLASKDRGNPPLFEKDLNKIENILAHMEGALDAMRKIDVKQLHELKKR